MFIIGKGEYYKKRERQLLSLCELFHSPHLFLEENALNYFQIQCYSLIFFKQNYFQHSSLISLCRKELAFILPHAIPFHSHPPPPQTYFSCTTPIGIVPFLILRIVFIIIVNFLPYRARNYIMMTFFLVHLFFSWLQ